MTDDEARALRDDVRWMRQRLAEVETRSGLMSPNFLTRVFSVWFYALVGQVVFVALLGGAMLALAFAGGLLAGFQ